MTGLIENKYDDSFFKIPIEKSQITDEVYRNADAIIESAMRRRKIEEEREKPKRWSTKLDLANEWLGLIAGKAILIGDHILMQKMHDVGFDYLYDQVYEVYTDSHNNIERRRISSLSLALKSGKLETVKKLVDLAGRRVLGAGLQGFGWSEDDSEITNVIKEKKLSEMKYLLDLGLNPDGYQRPAGCFLPHDFQSKGSSYLTTAAQYQSEEILDLLIERGGSISKALFNLKPYKFRDSCVYSGSETRLKDAEIYKRTLCCLLDRAIGLGFREDDLIAYLKEIDISGISFLGVFTDKGPISREMLKRHGLIGADKAITCEDEMMNLDEARRKTVTKYLTKEMQRHARFTTATSQNISWGFKKSEYIDQKAKEYLKENGLLKKDEFIHKCDQNGESLIHRIAKTENTVLMRALIHDGANIHQRTKKVGWYPLHFAAFSGRLDMVDFLIESGTPIDCQTFKKETPLHLAAAKGHSHVVQLLLSLGSNWDHEAIGDEKYNHRDDAITPITRTESKNVRELLSRAASEEMGRIVKAFKNAGRPYHFEKNDVKKIVEAAVRDGQIDVLRQWRDASVDVLSLTYDYYPYPFKDIREDGKYMQKQYTPIELALIDNRQIEVFKELVSWPEKDHIWAKEGKKRARSILLEEKNYELLSYWLDHGLDPNSSVYAYWDRYPLLAGHPNGIDRSIVKLLLRRRADPIPALIALFKRCDLWKNKREAAKEGIKILIEEAGPLNLTQKQFQELTKCNVSDHFLPDLQGIKVNGIQVTKELVLLGQQNRRFIEKFERMFTGPS